MTARVPASFEGPTVEATLGGVREDRSETVTPSAHPDDWFELYSVPAYPSQRPEIVRGIQVGSSKKTVEAGTVLVCKINPRINRVWVVRGDSGHKRIASTEWIPFFPRQDIHPDYLKYYLQRNEFRDYLASNVSGVGGSLMRVRPAVVDRYPFPKRPLRDQEAIVASLDSLFSRLDAAVVALRRTQGNLQRYRASVLKAAFEGRLVPTEAELARREGREYEPATVLLDRILKERRRQWENAQLAQRRAKGKEAQDHRWKGNYEEPELPDAKGLPDLAQGWTWARLGSIADTASGGTPSRRNPAYFGGAIPWVKSGELKDGSVREAEETITELALKESSAKLFPAGTICMAMYGATVGKLGTLEIEAATNQAVCGLFVSAGVEAAFLFWLLMNARSDLVARGRGGAQPNISQEIIQNTVIPLAPGREQGRIALEVERRMSLIDSLERSAEAAAVKAHALRQAILRTAFQGRAGLLE